MGIDSTDNELGVLEAMQLFVELLDKYFKGANELDIMFRYDFVVLEYRVLIFLV